MLAAAPLSDAKGRTGVLRAALLLASGIGLLIPFSPSFPALVALRALQGLALAGVPAVAMAYLAEEVEPSRAGATMGLFIGGNAVGGMTGRIAVGLLSAPLGWRGALLALAAFDLLLSAWFARNLPASSRFRPRSLDRAAIARGLLASLRDPALLGLHALAFLLMGSFVSVYNYLAFALEGPPWRLPPAKVSWVFLLYVAGVIASPAAGRLSDRIGRPRVLGAGTLLQLGGLLATLAVALPLKLAGLAVFTFGFFSAHAVASSWVSHRGGAEKAATSAHYLLAYYAGSSVVGTCSGIVFSRGGWGAVVTVIASLLLAAVAVAVALGAEGRSRALSSRRAPR